MSKRTPAQQSELEEADAELEALGAPLRNALMIVAHDAIVYAWVDILIRWGVRTLIVDEIHIASSYKARRSEAIKEIARTAVRRCGLSGTPMTNRPRDLHNVVDILCPGRFGVFFRPDRPVGSFAQVFCGSHQKTVGTGPEAKVVWDHNGASNQQLLHERLGYFMLRRVARDVDKELPALTRQIIDVRVPPAKTIMPTTDVLKDRKHLRRLLDLAADGKFKQVIDLIQTHIDEGEKVLVFCHRKIFAEAICKEFSLSTFVHGDLPQKERDRRIQEAEAHSGPTVLAATIESCSTGIDLSFASVIVFAELVWEPAEISQAEARSYKLGSGAKRLVQYVIAKGTGDELILRAVIAKLDDFEKIVGETGDSMRADLAKKESPEAALARLADALLGLTAQNRKTSAIR